MSAGSPPPRPERGTPPAADPAGAHVEMNMDFGSAVTLSDINSARTAISNGLYMGFEPFAFARIPEGDLGTVLAPRFGPVSRNLADKYRARLMGVEFSNMVTSLLEVLVASRLNGNYESLLIDLTFGVLTAYTVSRESSQDYSSLANTSVYKQYEISGRTRDEDPAVAKKNSWIAGSSMNASAVRLVGYLVVECAPKGGFLETLKTTKGTPFTPVDGGKELEKLLRTMKANLTESDEEALATFKDSFRKVIKVLDFIWGRSGASLGNAHAAATHLQGAVL